MDSLVPVPEEIKIIVIGDSNVGKSSLLTRFCNQQYNEHQQTTVGSEHYARDLRTDQGLVKLNLWDTAGQERFRAISKTFYRRSDAALLVFDWTNAKSYGSLWSYWSTEVQKVCEDIPLVVVANKCDLESSMDIEEVREECDRRNVCLIQTSCVSGNGVEDVFRHISSEVLVRRVQAANEAVSLDTIAGSSLYLQRQAPHEPASRGYCCGY